MGSGTSPGRAGTLGTSPERSMDMDKDMPWGWVLENLLDVKKLPLSFFKDIIRYLPHIEEPTCSRLLQKVALRYLDEANVTRKLDTCDILFLRFILKEQGLFDLRRIHSLKESLENDLTLRFETEAVLSNLRCSLKEGRIDWAAFEDAVDNVFPEDISEPRGIERRKELTAVLPDRSNGEPEEDLCRQILAKYPVEELCKDLTHFVDDKRKFFKIKFLDQLAKDVENGVYSSSPDSDSLDEMRTDFCDDCRIQDDLHCATALSESTPGPRQKDRCMATDEDAIRDPPYRVAGAKVSEPKDVQLEMSFRMAEVDKSANGPFNETHELANELAKFTEDLQNTARIPLSTRDLSDQQISHLSAPISENPVSVQPNPVVTCPAKSAEGDLEIDKVVEVQRDNRKSGDNHQCESLEKCTERDTLSQHRFESVAGASRITPEVRKRHEVETVDQHTGATKKKKINEGELSEEQRNRSVAAGDDAGFRLRPIAGNTFGEGPSNDLLSSDNVNTAATRVSENCRYDVSAATGGDRELNAECYVCGGTGGCQAFCHRCSVPVHEICLSELCMGQKEIENCWHCFSCAARLAYEGLGRAQEVVKEATENLRKAEQEVLTTQERWATFVRKEHSRAHQKEQNNVELNLSRPVIETHNECIKSINAEQFSTEDCRCDPGGEDRTLSSKSGTITATSASLSPSNVEKVMKHDTIRHTRRTREQTKMRTALQASVLSEGLHADQVSDLDLPRGGIDGQVPASVPSLPVSQGPENRETSGCCGEEDMGGRRSSSDRVLPMIVNANDDDTKPGSHDGLNEDVGATNIATNGSGVSRSQGGDSGPPSDSFLKTRNPEGEEGDGHDGDLEEVCEGNLAAAERTSAADQAGGVILERTSEASNAGDKSRGRKVYRVRKQIPGVRRRHLPWTEIEEDALKEGVKLFSNGGEWGFNWKRILAFGMGKFHESRTTVDLKDKWRNIVKRRQSNSSYRSS